MVQRYTHVGFSAKSADSISELFPVLKPEQLLASKYRQNMLARIERLAAGPKEHYQALWADLLTRFAAFVQELKHAEYAEFTLLDYHLALCETALALRIPFIGEDKTLTIAEDKEALWHYVIGTSAILQNIGRLVTRYSVALCNEKGHFVSAWEPFLTSMNEQPVTHYRVQQILLRDPEHTPKVSQLLAMHLMPRDGFLWIASDPDALAAWLDAVEGEAGGGGIIMRLLKASEQELFKRAREQRLLEAMRTTETLDHVAQKLDVASHEVLNIAPPLHGKLVAETAVGEAFFNWLKTGLHNGSIAVNTKDAMVHMTPDGVFLLYPPIFEAFSKAYPRYNDWSVVYRQFNYLGLAPLSGSDFVFAKYFSDRPGIVASSTQALHPAATQASDAAVKFFSQSSLFKSALSADHTPNPINPALGQQNLAAAVVANTAAPAQPTIADTATNAAAAVAATTAAQATIHTYAGLLVDPKFIFSQHLPSHSEHIHIHHRPRTSHEDMTASINEANARQFADHKHTSHQAVTMFFTRLNGSNYPALRFFTQTADSGMRTYYGPRNTYM